MDALLVSDVALITEALETPNGIAKLSTDRLETQAGRALYSAAKSIWIERNRAQQAYRDATNARLCLQEKIAELKASP